jgi:hypothetical protein
LGGKQQQQLDVDAERDEWRPERTGIDTLWNEGSADEADCIEQRRQQDRINRNLSAEPDKRGETSLPGPAGLVGPMVDRDGHCRSPEVQSAARTRGGLSKPPHLRVQGAAHGRLDMAARQPDIAKPAIV